MAHVPPACAAQSGDTAVPARIIVLQLLLRLRQSSARRNGISAPGGIGLDLSAAMSHIFARIIASGIPSAYELQLELVWNKMV
jgi:hypothetical protein